MYKIVLAPGVCTQIEQLSPFEKRKLDEVFSELMSDPYSCYSANEMRGGSFTRYRCKFGDHRIIYSIVEARVEVYVLKIGHRGTVYKDEKPPS